MTIQSTSVVVDTRIGTVTTMEPSDTTITIHPREVGYKELMELVFKILEKQTATP
jgi:hypothetical protein